MDEGQGSEVRGSEGELGGDAPCATKQAEQGLPGGGDGVGVEVGGLGEGRKGLGEGGLVRPTSAPSHPGQSSLGHFTSRANRL